MAPLPEILPSGEYILLPDTPLLPWTEEGFAELTIWTKLFLVRFFTNLTILTVLISVLAVVLYLALGIQRRVTRLFSRYFGGSPRGRFPESEAHKDESKTLLSESGDPSPPDYYSYRDDVRATGPATYDPSLTGHSCLSSPNGIRLLHQRLSLMGPPDSPLRMRRLRQVSGAESIK